MPDQVNVLVIHMDKEQMIRPHFNREVHMLLLKPLLLILQGFIEIRMACIQTQEYYLIMSLHLGPKDLLLRKLFMVQQKLRCKLQKI